MSNQDVVNGYATRIDAAADVQLAATTANTTAIDALRAEVAAGAVEVPLDTTAIEAATAKSEAAAAAATVPPAEPAPAA